MDPRHLLFLLFAFLVVVSHQTVVGSEVNVEGSERNETMLFGDGHNRTDVTVTDDYEESEEEDESTEEDLIRVEPVVKPNNTKEGEKKKGDKKKEKAGKGKGNKKNKRAKKVNPCETTHQGFCIHGECIHLEHLEKVACRCHLHYNGERCSEQILESLQNMAGQDLSDASVNTLIVVAVVLSAISFIAIIIVIVVHTHKKYSSGYEGEVEEKKKLGQENGSGELDV
ncbi:amphiregulin [Microcaecilia unicolor]|uniref:Amphiregulin n=1 Tax=Microcaecilia unicolor TaxID=1415580 RepID=A0A6P7X8H2_9AMPH|nr:amphiregulin [Microcaecilia unicolor]